MNVRNVILATGWYLPESIGGTEIYVAALAKNLKMLGHRLTVIVPSVGDYVSHDRHDDIPVFRYPIPGNPTYDEIQGKCPPRLFSHYVEMIHTLKPDLVHFHTTSWSMGIYHVKAAKEMGCRTILTNHTAGLGYLCPRGTGMIWGKKMCDGLVTPWRCSACLIQQKGIHPAIGSILASTPSKVSEKIETTFSQNKLATLIGLPAIIQRRKKMQSEMHTYLDAMVSLTDWGREILVRNGAPINKILLSRLGTSQKIKVAMPKVKSNRLVVGYIGRFDPIKGLDFLVKAIMRLPKQAPIMLKIYAISNINDDYENFIRRLAKSDCKIEFYPPVEPSHLPEIFQAIDVLAVPSICMEGGPTVLLEALACKVPIIGSNIGAIPEYIRHGKNGLLFPPANIYAIEETLRELLSNKELITNLRNGITEVRSAQQIAFEMSNLYERLHN